MDRLNKIERLKDELRATDYIALKYAEGIDCSQYGNWKEARQELRNEINRFIDMTDDEYNELYPEVIDENTTDMVTGTYFYNQGTGEFIAGGIV